MDALLRQVYTLLPSWLQFSAKSLYRKVNYHENFFLCDHVTPPPDEVQQSFVNEFFESQNEYRRLSREFDLSTPVQLYDEHEEVSGAERVVRDNYKQLYDEHNSRYHAGIRMMEGRAIYTLVRKLQPSVLVETGVANGWSTACILAALEKNMSGKLYSVDYPNKSCKNLEEFESENIFGQPKIPANKSSGWLVPHELRDRWELRLGRSQRELPKLMSDLENIDFFYHDSEHTDPCMMFEFELAWEFLDECGLLVSDDMSPSLAWEVFANVREPSSSGIMAYPKMGYLSKNIDS
jgi:predicted O-methyltransferase YrrM